MDGRVTQTLKVHTCYHDSHAQVTTAELGPGSGGGVKRSQARKRNPVEFVDPDKWDKLSWHCREGSPDFQSTMNLTLFLSAFLF